MNVDLIVHSARQLVTCAGAGLPKRGESLADPGIISDGALAASDGLIVAVGRTAEVLAGCVAAWSIDATGRVVCPGFVDPHTHAVYAGERIDEFEMRVRGASYMEILQAGGGILNTMRATRQATVDELAEQARRRLDTMLALGTTTVEIKTGYGLDIASELNMLKAMEKLHLTHPVDVVPTFLGAHAVPPEYKGRTDEYVGWIIEAMMPAVAEWYQGSVFAAQGIPLFCDVFCEAGVFDREQAARLLAAGLAHDMRPKIHADEFQSIGGVSLACDVQAVSADHLDVTPDEELRLLAGSDVVGVLLPAVNFNLGSTHFAPARKMVDAGVLVALATDINPGSAPCPSMPLVMAISCRYQRLLPSEALNASALNAAYAVGLGHRVGSLEVGKRADLLVLRTSDYRYLAYQFGASLVDTVVKAGEVVYRDGLSR